MTNLPIELARALWLAGFGEVGEVGVAEAPALGGWMVGMRLVRV